MILIKITLMVGWYMANSFENLIDLIVAILIFFLFPIALLNQQKDMIIQTYVENTIDTFVNTVSNKGYITRDLYNGLNQSIGPLIDDYELVFEHEYRVFYPNNGANEGYTNNHDYQPIYFKTYTDEIIKVLQEQDKHYYFNHGDRFRVSLLEDDNIPIYIHTKKIRGGN